MQKFSDIWLLSGSDCGTKNRKFQLKFLEYSNLNPQQKYKYTILRSIFVNQQRLIESNDDDDDDDNVQRPSIVWFFNS